MTKAVHSFTAIDLLLTTQWLTCLNCKRSVMAVQEPEKHTSEETSADYIAECYRNHGLIDEFADTKVRPVKHTDGNEKEVRNRMLVAECHAGDRIFSANASWKVVREVTTCWDRYVQRPDGQPNSYYLAELVLAACSKEDCEAHKPIASDTPGEVVTPVDIDSTLCTRHGV